MPPDGERKPADSPNPACQPNLLQWELMDCRASVPKEAKLRYFATRPGLVNTQDAHLTRDDDSIGLEAITIFFTAFDIAIRHVDRQLPDHNLAGQLTAR